MESTVESKEMFEKAKHLKDSTVLLVTCKHCGITHFAHPGNNDFCPSLLEELKNAELA